MGDKQIFKVLILGDSGVGKTCMLLRLTDDEFKEGFVPTIGSGDDYKVHQLESDGKPVSLKVWDTAGQERFRTITSSYYRGANGILLVYDVSDKTALDGMHFLILGVKQWKEEIETYAQPETIIFLVGNKTDLDRGTSTEDGQVR